MREVSENEKSKKTIVKHKQHEREKLLLSGFEPGTSTMPSTPPRGNTKKQLSFGQSLLGAFDVVYSTSVWQSVSKLTGKTANRFISVKNRVATREVKSNKNVKKVNSKIPIKKGASVDKKEKPVIKKAIRKVSIEIVPYKNVAVKSFVK